MQSSPCKYHLHSSVQSNHTSRLAAETASSFSFTTSFNFFLSENKISANQAQKSYSVHL